MGLNTTLPYPNIISLVTLLYALMVKIMNSPEGNTLH